VAVIGLTQNRAIRRAEWLHDQRFDGRDELNRDVQSADPTTYDANEGVRLCLLERSGLLAPGPDPELDRWTAALRRATGAAVAALAVPMAGCTRISGLWKGDMARAETAEVPASESLERFLSAHVDAPPWPDGAHSYLAAPVAIDGHVLCTLAVADAAPRDWDARDAQILDDATAAVAAEIRLRLANEQAVRFHELVASQHRVHELIAGGAPLGDVLIELVGESSATTRR
jgi:hypothetical protein